MRPLSEIRKDRTLAHVVPLAVFMVITFPYLFVGDLIEWKHPEAPWWRHYPDHWIYPLQSLICLGLLIFFRKNYEWNWRKGWGFASIMGVIGIGFWILPTHLHMVFGLDGEQEGILKWLGVMPRDDGFDPQDLADKFGGSQGVYWSSLVMRFFRAVVIVSLVEEIFWRGFLMRFLLDPDRDYWKVPFGKPAWISYGVVTGAFILVHQPVDYLGALIFGSLMYWVAVRTKSLMACVVMHGVANLLMGLYAMHYGKYGLW